MSTNVDLSQLMPESFLSSPLLVDYLSAISTLFNGVQDDIAGLYDLVNPRTVPTAYLQQLANLIGLQLRTSTIFGPTQQRQQLINAVEWYKMKGTYQSLSYIAYLLGLNVAVKDFYTNDYITFVPESWFVDLGGGTNPPGLDSSYYKSPHFGLYILLNQVYGTYPTQYLWDDSVFDDFEYFVEQTRPVQTVPHYLLQLSPEGREFGGVVEVSGNIYGAVTNWAFSSNFFDESVAYDSNYFWDDSYTGFLDSITNWKLGTGNINETNPPAGGIANPVLTGTGVVLESFDTYNTFTVTIPLATVQAGLTEFGLYQSDGTTPVFICYFPSINKTANEQLNITVTISKT